LAEIFAQVVMVITVSPSSVFRCVDALCLPVAAPSKRSTSGTQTRPRRFGSGALPTPASICQTSTASGGRPSGVSGMDARRCSSAAACSAAFESRPGSAISSSNASENARLSKQRTT